MTCDYGLEPGRCMASPWCGHENNLPGALPTPEQLDLFGDDE